MAARTVENICNLALSRIGVRKLITSIDDSSAEAQACSAVYGIQRDVALQSFWWPFATKRVALAVLETEEEQREEWEYVYTPPADLLAVQYVTSGLRGGSVDSRISFEMESNLAGDGQVLLTDQVDAVLAYTIQQDNAATYSPAFVDALAYLLAAELALPLAAKPSLEQANRQRYELALQRAKGAAMRERQEDVPGDPEAIAARY